MALYVAKGQGDSFIRFVCRSCGWSFTRLTNVEQPLTMPCSHCKNGIMDMEEA